MIFFHGGGYMCGSGIKPFYGPDYLLEHDVVYIGANFRLGPLGFLSTGQEDCWGNFGLKDQVQTLRWIKENIASFGGDPNSVTIFGESAGGASVTYHMQSSLSKGLFHRGISQSGTDLAPWGAVAHKNVAQGRAKRLGEMMGCPLENANYRAMIECLKAVPAANITEAFYEFFEWDTDQMVPFPPVVEGQHDEAFLTEDPRFKTDMHGNEVPWMTGVTTEEGAMKSAPLIYNFELTNDLLKNWDRALPISLYYSHHSIERQQEITTKINEFYFKNQKLTTSTQQNLTNLYTDGWFFHAMIDYLKLRFVNEKRGDTFVYLFSHKGSCSFTEIFKGGSEAYYGTSHAEELQYLFPIRKDLPYFFNSIPTEEDKKVSKLITKLWVSFAYTGQVYFTNCTNSIFKMFIICRNPTPDGSDLPKWTPAQGFPLDYMRIGNDKGQSTDLLVMENNLYPDRAQFWDDLKAHYPAEETHPKTNVKGEL